MTAGWCSRTLRAAVFAAVCVLLTSLGHVMMSGTSVPWWAMAAGAAVTGGTAWHLAGRERGPVLVGSVTVAAQAALHMAFSFAQALAHPEPTGSKSLVQQWLGYLLCGSASGRSAEHDAMPTSMSSMDHGMGAMHSMGSMDHMRATHSLDHGMGGMSSSGMLAGHLLAALLCGLWLAHGERAAFRILRALAGWLVAPLRLILQLPAPPHRPRVRVRRGRSERTLRQLLLTHTITSRGPPAGTAVA
ncbi:hypothetical protein [Streptomyces sp. DH10]|uniref:hypothetical protein n=1 Tax=Streptomyces sp. DH10 TaxID=3040121 RepID=UPI002441C482|nr:hypothetical protein [Streptomyces sp. DH10]MDG9709444.1 hypothetical protein [Streptomyces sp. DH10]